MEITFKKKTLKKTQLPHKTQTLHEIVVTVYWADYRLSRMGG